MTDNEIIKGLECCTNNEVSSCKKKDCPFRKFCQKDIDALEKASLDLINRQKAEIERLKAEIVIRDKIIDERGKEVVRHDSAIRSLHKQLDNLKSEAIKEFAERLKAKVPRIRFMGEVFSFADTEDIDNLVKEMVGEAE